MDIGWASLHNMWKEIRKLKRLWLILLIPISFLLLFLAKYNHYIAEYLFARGYYKYLSVFINRLTGMVPFSIGEALVLVLPLGILFFIASLIYKLVHNPAARKKTLYITIINILVAISLLSFLFTALCGVNYYRYDFSHYLEFEVEEYTVDELYQVCRNLAYSANGIKQQIGYEKENNENQATSGKKITKEALDAFQELANQYPVFQTNYSEPKSIWLSKYLSYTQIVGIFNPFTMEANINVDVPFFTIPANMCHELAHMYGFMKEEEANYISYLACMNSKNPEFMYSGILLALSYAMGELYEADYTKYVQIYHMFNGSVLGDLYVERDYWKNVKDNGYQRSIAEASNTINNVYLKINGQMNGIKSYEAMVKFLVAEYRNR